MKQQILEAELKVCITLLADLAMFILEHASIETDQEIKDRDNIITQIKDRRAAGQKLLYGD